MFDAAALGGVVTLFYSFRLSWRLALGMTAIFLLAYWAVIALHAALGLNLLWLSIAIFVLAWIGQFIGHHVERARPSFFKDLQFLLIGPLWLLAAVYRSMSIPTGRSAAAPWPARRAMRSHRRPRHSQPTPAKRQRG